MTDVNRYGTFRSDAATKQSFDGRAMEPTVNPFTFLFGIAMIIGVVIPLGMVWPH